MFACWLSHWAQPHRAAGTAANSQSFLAHSHTRKWQRNFKRNYCNTPVLSEVVKWNSCCEMLKAVESKNATSLELLNYYLKLFRGSDHLKTLVRLLTNIDHLFFYHTFCLMLIFLFNLLIVTAHNQTLLHLCGLSIFCYCHVQVWMLFIWCAGTDRSLCSLCWDMPIINLSGVLHKYMHLPGKLVILPPLLVLCCIPCSKLHSSHSPVSLLTCS